MPDVLQPVLSAIREVTGETCRFGTYLHGSHARGTAGPSSDVDVLVLCAADVSTADRDAFRDRCLNEAPVEPGTLDVKVIPVALFTDDPWVDLQKARWVAGRQWHRELPPRSLDKAARESLLVLRVLVVEEAFAQAEVAAVRKAVGRLCSVVVALVDDTAPSSAAEAVATLIRYRSDGTVRRLIDVAGRLEAAGSGTVPPDLAGDILGCVAAVVERLRGAVHGGVLGLRSAVAARDVLTAWDDVSRIQMTGVQRSLTDSSQIPADLRAWIATELGAIDEVRDASWPRASSRVWEVTAGERSMFVKLAPSESDFDREVLGARYAERIFDDQRAPRLMASHRRLGATMTTSLSGQVVRGLPLDLTAELRLYTDAGRLLRRWHDHGDDATKDQRASARAATDAKAVEVHRCLLRTAGSLRPEQHDLVHAASNELPELAHRLPVVFQHGDYATRNWLWDHAHGRLGLIDFATVRWGAAAEELVWLRAAVWAARPDLETAFFAGYGRTLSAQEERLIRLLTVRMGVTYLDIGLRNGRHDLAARGRLILDHLTTDRPAVTAPSP